MPFLNSRLVLSLEHVDSAMSEAIFSAAIVSGFFFMENNGLMCVAGGSTVNQSLIIEDHETVP